MVIKIHKLDKRSVEFFVLVFLFRIALDFSYSRIIAKHYAYAGFIAESTVYSSILSWALLVVFSALLLRDYKNQEEKVSAEIAFFLFLMSFVPFTCMIEFSAITNQFMLFNTIYWGALITFLRLFRARSINRIHSHSLNSKVIGNQQIKVIAILFAVVILYISWRYTHFRLNFSLLDVYELRSESRSYGMPTILKYVFSWTKMTMSIIIAYFLKRKEWIWAIGCVLIQLLSFGIDGSKTTLILMLFTIAIFMIPAFNLEMCNKWVLRGFVLIICVSLIWFAYSKDIFLISLFVRRVFFIPVQIAGDYVDFFCNNVPDYFRQSFLRYFGFKSPYEESLSYLIGHVYANTISSFNNGLVSDGIANLGLPGLVIMPFTLALVLKILDNCADKLDERIYITVALYASVVLINSFLFTVLLTHGLIVAMLLLKMMERDNGSIEISASGSSNMSYL